MMAEQTVREQLAEALEKTAEAYHRLWCPDRTPFKDCTYPTCADSRAALDRARAEPETHRREDLLVALDELFAGEYAHHHASDQAYDLWANAHKAFKTAQSELSCPDICDTSCRCYQEGLEAQRERVG